MQGIWKGKVFDRAFLARLKPCPICFNNIKRDCFVTELLSFARKDIKLIFCNHRAICDGYVVFSSAVLQAV